RESGRKVCVQHRIESRSGGTRGSDDRGTEEALRRRSSGIGVDRQVGEVATKSTRTPKAGSCPFCVFVAMNTARMEPITHGVLGAVAARAVFGKRLPPGGAVVAGLAAMAPDIDLFIHPSSDPTAIWVNHRNFTHGLAFVPVGAALSALPFLVFKRF